MGDESVDYPVIMQVLISALQVITYRFSMSRDLSMRNLVRFGVFRKIRNPNKETIEGRMITASPCWWQRPFELKGFPPIPTILVRFNSNAHIFVDAFLVFFMGPAVTKKIDSKYFRIIDNLPL